MLSRWQTSAPGWLVLVLALTGSAADRKASYEPVGTPAALHLVLRSNLLVVRDWLKEKDFASAAETIRGLTTLAELASNQSADAGWRKRCGELQQGITRLAAAAGRKAGPDADKALAECSDLLEELAKNAPGVEGRTGPTNFKPAGSTKTWMLVMEWSHVDAKSAKTARELDLLAQAIAEEANAVAWLKNDATWRADSLSVRDAALKVATQARDDFAGAKKALKGVAQRCEVCHDRTRKK